MRLRSRPSPSLNWKQEGMALVLTAWRIGTTKSDYLSMWQWAANQLIESVVGEIGNDFGKRWTKKVGLRGKCRFGDHLPVTKDWEMQASRSSSLLTNSAGTLGRLIDAVPSTVWERSAKAQGMWPLPLVKKDQERKGWGTCSSGSF